jgi:hypothetical protein
MIREGRCAICIKDRGLERTPILPLSQLHKSKSVRNALLCDYHYSQEKDLVS